MRGRDLDVALRMESAWGCSPWWDVGGQELHWADATIGAVHRYDPLSRADVVFARLRPPVPVVVPVAAPGAAPAVAGSESAGMHGWLVGQSNGIAVLDADGDVAQRAAVPGVGTTLRVTSGTCDAAGRCWLTAAGLEGDVSGSGEVSEPGDVSGPGDKSGPEATVAAGRLFRIGPGLDVARVDAGGVAPAGIGWSADGRSVFLADAGTSSVRVAPFGVADGTIGDDRLLVDLHAGGPKGAAGAGVVDLAVDIAGCVWVALRGVGEVRRYSATGRLDTVVELPVTQPTACTFGGLDNATLFITTGWDGLDPVQRRKEPLAGALFAVQPGIAGVMPHAYRR